MRKKVTILTACIVALFCGLWLKQTIAAGENTQAENSVKFRANSSHKILSKSFDSLALNSFTATPNLAIPDNTYNGTLGSMTCSTINTASLPPGSFVGDVQVQLAMSHTFVGDLTIKLISPSGSLLGLVSRPGVAETADDGNDSAGFGENSNLAIANPLTYTDSAATLSEQMGKVPIDLTTIQTICVDGGSPCSYRPSQGSITGSLTSFQGFDGQNAVGNWQLCIGDAGAADTGVFNSWTLTLATFPTTAANASIVGRAVTPSGQGISNATIVLTGGALAEPRLIKTNSFGYYRIEELPVGQTYILTIQSKRYTFTNPTQVVNLQESINNMDFIGSME